MVKLVDVRHLRTNSRCIVYTHKICEIYETLSGIVSLFFEQFGLGDRSASQASLQFPGKSVNMSNRFHRLAGWFCT